MQILKTIEGYAEHVILITMFCVLSMIAYALTSPEPPRSRTKSMFAGGVISLILSYPTWVWIGSMTVAGVLAVYWLIPITFVYTVAGQFIPEFLQSAIPKLAKKLLNKGYRAKTGEDFENDN